MVGSTLGGMITGKEGFSARNICDLAAFVGESGKVPSEARYIPMDNDASSLHTRPSLLVRIRDPQDAESWRSFVELYTPPVLRYCRLRDCNTPTSADVTQEVMAQVARSMRSFRYAPEGGRFRDWLGTITRRKVNRHLTKRNLGTEGGGGNDTPEGVNNPRVIEADPDWSAEFNAKSLGLRRESSSLVRSRNVERVCWCLARESNRGPDCCCSWRVSRSGLCRQVESLEAARRRGAHTGRRLPIGAYETMTCLSAEAWNGF